VESLLQRANIAIYDAKRVGRTFELYAADQDENSTDRLVLLGELREGIREGALVVHYQPKAEITTGRVHSVEALVRWQHPTRGLVPPDRFIPLAESAGMMAELTACVLDQSLAQLRRWLDDGHELRMAVNMSARNLHDLNFPSVVEEHLLRHGVEAGALELELTETSLLVEPARALVVLTELHRLGVRLAIDDFGTGYSSLAYLKRLPIHALKIDRSFVQDMTTNANDRVIVHSTIGLARNLGLEVVAEGVESNEAWAELQADGCDVAQGYLIARPMDSSAATDWIEQWAADGFDPPRLVGDAAEA
jgi:EAL domain-containing protein (putative c-di-GMP-specific phosphodiesterase class I)